MSKGARYCGHLQTDETTADNDHTAGRSQSRTKCDGIIDGSQVADARPEGVDSPGVRARCDHDVARVDRAPVRQRNRRIVGRQGDGAHPEPQVDSEVVSIAEECGIKWRSRTDQNIL
jgi:hypothetical protein